MGEEKSLIYFHTENHEGNPLKLTYLSGNLKLKWVDMQFHLKIVNDTSKKDGLLWKLFFAKKTPFSSNHPL